MKRKYGLLLGIVLLTALISLSAAEPKKVKVIVDGATIYAIPEIGSNVQAKVALGMVLQTDTKEGSWYKVTMEREGVTISGYIHEMLVEPTSEEVSPAKEQEISPAVVRSQAEIIASIELRMEENKALIRAKENLDKALASLEPLIAKTFRIEDYSRQRQLATEIYLWMGLAHAGRGDFYSALNEFRNMYEVDDIYAKELSRNILESEIADLILLAEKEYKGLITEYAFEISTEPKEARIRIDGVDMGLSPEVVRLSVPKFSLQIDKKGYKQITDEIFLTEAAVKKEYVLERAGQDLLVISDPSGAKVFLDGEDTGQVTECTLPLVSFGTHTIRLEKSFHAPWEGEVDIVLSDRPLEVRAEMPANVYRYFRKWGGAESNLFQQPSGIDVDAENFIYIVDLSNSKLKKFDTEGKLIGVLGRDERELRDLKEPTGLAVDTLGNLYIPDMKKHCLFKFSRSGQFITKWGQKGNESQDFLNPAGIAVDSDNNIFVVDSGNSRVKKYSPNGVVQKIWGSRGDQDGQFIYPSAVAVSPENEIYVADRSRIQRFTRDGAFLGSWGLFGRETGQFNKPLDIAVDARGYVYVADTGNHRVQKFDEKGRFISQWGTPGTGDGQMSMPSGLAVDTEGFIFVLEKNGNRLQVFSVPPSAK